MSSVLGRAALRLDTAVVVLFSYCHVSRPPASLLTPVSCFRRKKMNQTAFGKLLGHFFGMQVTHIHAHLL